MNRRALVAFVLVALPFARPAAAKDEVPDIHVLNPLTVQTNELLGDLTLAYVHLPLGLPDLRGQTFAFYGAPLVAIDAIRTHRADLGADVLLVVFGKVNV